jgi:hypothetical protein
VVVDGGTGLGQRHRQRLLPDPVRGQPTARGRLLAAGVTGWLVRAGEPGLNSWELDSEPEDEEAVEAHAAFRSWVESELATTVPDTWTVTDPDPFEAWVGRMQDER